MTLSFFSSRDFTINNPSALGTDCGKCKLYRTCKTPRMQECGEGRKGILIVAEAPGKTEDVKGRPLCGPSGQYLDDCLRSFGINPYLDCIKTNAVCCRPPENRDPTTIEIKNCQGRLWSLIQRVKPKLIIVVGQIAIQGILGFRWYDTDDGLGTVDRWHGYCSPDRETNCWVGFVYHPVRMLRQEEKQSVVNEIFYRDMERLLSHLNKPMPQYKPEKDCVEIITNEKLIEKRLQILMTEKYDNNLFCIDYETNSLKPYNNASKVYCVGISTSPDSAITFPLFDIKTGRWFNTVYELFCQFCEDARRKKMAHNAMFEDAWTRVWFGTQMQGWHTCTMLDAHVLDNRKASKSLKFQTYVHLGLSDYSSEISQYLITPKNASANVLNEIDKAPQDKLLLYNGIDCITEHRLYKVQQELFNDTTFN